MIKAGVKPDYKSEENEKWSTDNKLLEITNFELAVYPLTVAQFQPFLDQSGYQEDRYWSRAGRHWRDREPRKTMPAYWNDPT